MATARKYVMESQFQGEPKRSDLKIVEEDLPPLNDGGRERRLQCCSYSCLYFFFIFYFIFFTVIRVPPEFLIEAVWLSVDPYMR